MARRRYKRPKKQHGWDLMAAVNDVVLGDSTPGNIPYLIVRAIQSYQGGASNLVGEPDPFYCERIIMDIYPFVFRVDPANSIPQRTWQYMLLTAELSQFLSWAEFGAISLQLASFWDASSELFDLAARILVQGTAPVYDEAGIPQDGYGGPLFTGATGAPEVYAATTGTGPEKVHLDIDATFSLNGEDHALIFLAGPAPTADWDDGDQFTTEIFCKSLWTRRRI